MQSMEEIKIKRDFKGIWIPKEVWMSQDLSLMEKVLFVEIHSLDNERGCFASNQYFADFFGVSARQIRTHITSLKDKGYVSMTIRNQNERVIRAAGKYRRISDHHLKGVEMARRDLAHKFSVRRRLT